jgi:hypothetical protein
MSAICSATSLRSLGDSWLHTSRLALRCMFRPFDVWQRLKGSNQFLEAAEGQQRGLAWRLSGEIRASNGDISVPAWLQFD